MQSTLCQSFWGVGGGQGGAGAGSPLSLWVGRKGPPCPPGWDKGDFRGQHLCSGKYMSCGGVRFNPRGEGNRAPLPSTPGPEPHVPCPGAARRGRHSYSMGPGPPPAPFSSPPLTHSCQEKRGSSPPSRRWGSRARAPPALALLCLDSRLRFSKDQKHNKNPTDLQDLNIYKKKKKHKRPKKPLKKLSENYYLLY